MWQLVQNGQPPPKTVSDLNLLFVLPYISVYKLTTNRRWTALFCTTFWDLFLDVYMSLRVKCLLLRTQSQLNILSSVIFSIRLFSISRKTIIFLFKFYSIIHQMIVSLLNRSDHHIANVWLLLSCPLILSSN